VRMNEVVLGCMRWCENVRGGVRMHIHEVV
jgi:hypothetical protein